MSHFHPVLVHLPIGILLLACFFQWLTLKDSFTVLQPAIPLMFFWGMLTAVASCITGYLLAQSGDYDGELIGKHQWLGISTAIISLLLYLMYKMSVRESIMRWGAAILFIIIIITGHLGGSLTHGPGFLTEGLGGTSTSKGPILKPIPNVQEAVLYTDIVQPILEARCYTCHGPNKQKGKLRLDEQRLILKGGKDGPALIPGKADESEMIERMLLPESDKDHMPPREKPQLTKDEIALLHWWVNTGAPFDKKVKELAASEKIKPVLVALQTGAVEKENKISDIPEKPVEQGDSVIINRLKRAGVIIIPVARNSNYLSASFFTATQGADSLLKMLLPLKKQLVWLKLDHAAIGDGSASDIAQLTSLTRLQLNNTGIADQGLDKLSQLKSLQSINLVGTKVTSQGVLKLKQITGLKNIYLYQTGVSGGDWQLLKKSFPNTNLDSGRYTVPTFASDTTEVKAP